eukprot:2595505-Lingulodinium_polyedra.AAC.1
MENLCARFGASVAVAIHDGMVLCRSVLSEAVRHASGETACVLGLLGLQFFFQKHWDQELAVAARTLSAQ